MAPSSTENLPNHFRLLFIIINKKDGYRQWNVRQFLHILASTGYVPVTIAVSITWMERGFNAGQTHTHLSSTVYEL